VATRCSPSTLIPGTVNRQSSSTSAMPPVPPVFISLGAGRYSWRRYVRAGVAREIGAETAPCCLGDDIGLCTPMSHRMLESTEKQKRLMIL
jgi:hypothetical protein